MNLLGAHEYVARTVARPGRCGDGAEREVQRAAARDRGEHDRLADEAREFGIVRPPIERNGVGDLHEPAAPQHGDAIAERERFGLIVRHQERRRADGVERGHDGLPRLDPARRIERGERLVEQHEARRGCERAREGDALLFAARERLRRAPRERRRQADELEQLRDAMLHAPLRTR